MRNLGKLLYVASHYSSDLPTLTLIGLACETIHSQDEANESRRNKQLPTH